jgi:hypothetical protein
VSVCLKGSLDDFSIADILQVISYGGKTGYLSLETRAGGGVIVFRKGRVLASVDDGGAPLEVDVERASRSSSCCSSSPPAGTGPAPLKTGGLPAPLE